MIPYLRSERLKLKRTFSAKLIFLVPIANVAFSLLMNPMYFVSNTINWWSILFLPLMLVLWCSLTHQKEQLASSYQGVYLLPVSLRNIWLAKLVVMGSYSLAALAVYLLVMGVVGMLFTGESIITMATLMSALVLWITTLWEIPLFLWIARKWGAAAAIGINIACAMGLGIPFSTRTFWWACPWSWSIRLMAPIAAVHPNGTLLEPGHALLDMKVLPVGIGMSLLLTVVLSMLTMQRFGPQIRSGKGGR